MEYVELNNGVEMPKLGFGVYQVASNEMDHAISKALEVGYRAVDTASFYANEEELGSALKQSKLKREDLFVTTKVWNDAHGYEATLAAFEESRQKLGLDYIDLYLIHWPCPDFNSFIETYKALEHLYKTKQVRAIGVCNFHQSHLEQLLEECEIVPVVNQVERNPYFQQEELASYCRSKGIALQAWAPLMKGKVLDDPILKELGARYNKTPAQITLRWHLQTGWIAIPKSITESRIQENFEIFDFTLTDEELEDIAKLDRGARQGKDPNDMHML